MIRIQVHSGNVETISYTNKRTGQPATLRKQYAYAYTCNEHGEVPPYPEKFGFLLERDQPAYAPGDYTLHASAVFLDREGRLSVAPRLVPVKPKQ